MTPDNKFIPNNTTKWLKNIADYYTNSASSDVRDLKNMTENYNIMSDILDLDALNKELNPMGLPQSKNQIPTSKQIISVIRPSVNTLIGEFYDRPIDFKAFVVNSDAVSDKEKMIKDKTMSKLASLLEDKELSEEEKKLEIVKLQQWGKYEAQDIREKAANYIIKDYMERLKFTQVNKEGWKDFVYNSQQMYLFDVTEGNVIMKNIDPRELKIYGLPNNGNVHESEALSYERYMTITEIMAQYNLSKKDIKTLLDSSNSISTGTSDILIFSKEPVTNKKGELEYDVDTGKFFSGNKEIDNLKILVKTVYFKAIRKIKKLAYIEDSGEEVEELVDSQYIPMEGEGEKYKIEYIPEYWQITKILEDVYIDGKQCPVQMRDMNNPKIVFAPIVGKILMNKGRLAPSIIDTLKPIQHRWTIFDRHLSKLWSRNYGQLVTIDISKIPKKYGFDLDLFMSWIESYGIVVVDPFNEMKGGMQAGQYGDTIKSINMELSHSIQMALQYMVYLKELADEIVGITRQRKGELMASDGLGTTRESISRANKITEELFQEHHELQKVLLQYIVEYVKESIRSGKNKKIQFISDDMSSIIYNIEIEQFTEADYGIFINNTRKQFELEQAFVQISHAAMQNGIIKLSDIIELYNTNSLSDKLVKLKIKEEERELQQQQQQERQEKAKQELQQNINELEEKKMQHEIELQKLKNEADVMVAKIQAAAKEKAAEIQSEDKQTEIEKKKESEIIKNKYNYLKQIKK